MVKFHSNFCFCYLANMLKDRLSKTSGWQFHNVFSSPKSFRDFRETGSRGPGIDTEFKKKKKQYLLAEVLLIAQ